MSKQKVKIYTEKKLKTVQNKKVMLMLTLINLLSSTAIGCI